MRAGPRRRAWAALGRWMLCPGWLPGLSLGLVLGLGLGLFLGSLLDAGVSLAEGPSAAAPSAPLAPVHLSLRLQPRALHLDETALLRIQVAGANRVLDPRPRGRGLLITPAGVSRRREPSAGPSRMVVTFLYRVRALEPGDFVVNVGEVEADGSRLSSPGLPLTVWPTGEIPASTVAAHPLPHPPPHPLPHPDSGFKPRAFAPAH
ncbi:MAG: BatD family protein [Deltaproteobacteria bacterium]|nr:BatD family protein [Deltaproteobacteria bacterium]